MFYLFHFLFYTFLFKLLHALIVHLLFFQDSFPHLGVPMASVSTGTVTPSLLT